MIDGVEETSDVIAKFIEGATSTEFNATIVSTFADLAAEGSTAVVTVKNGTETKDFTITLNVLEPTPVSATVEELKGVVKDLALGKAWSLAIEKTDAEEVFGTLSVDDILVLTFANGDTAEAAYSTEAGGKYFFAHNSDIFKGVTLTKVVLEAAVVTVK